MNIIPPPAAPSLSGPSSTLNGSVALSWSAPANATSYKLYAQYYSLSAGAWGSYTVMYSGSGRSSSQSLTGDQKYAHYYVSACDQAGCSGAGNTLTVTYVNPAAPTLSAPASTSDGSVFLSWTIPSGATSFQLYGAYQSRTTSVWGAYTVIYSGSASTHTDTIGTMKAAASYYVKACNAPGCGSASSAKTVSYDLAGSTSGCKYCSPTVSTQSTQGTPATGTISVPAATTLPPAATDNAAPPADPNAANPAAADSGNASTGTDTPPPPASGGPLAMANRSPMHADAIARAGKAISVPAGTAMEATPVSAIPASINSAQSSGGAANEPSFTFAPSVYQYYADARIEPASVTTNMAQFIVQYEYTSTGYLKQIENARDTSEVYWQLDSNAAVPALSARGQVQAEVFGNGIQSTRTYDPASGYLTTIQSGKSGGSGIQNLSYVWEPLGNLSNRNDGNRGLNESFSYDTLNRLTGAVLTNGSGNSSTGYAYDAIGNITSKSDTGTYTYGGTAGPHAVTSIAGVQPGTYQYDADGNMTDRNGTAITWNPDNLPTQIMQDANNSSTFSYAPDKHRYYQNANVSGTTETTVYIGDMEIVTRNGITDYRQRLSAYGKDVGEFIVSTDVSHDQMTYILTDHLGSVDVVTDSTGATVSGTGWSFGAFGKRREATTWSGAPASATVSADRDITHHGFTNQEMLDNVGLQHFGGRIYDQNLGRFLSVDPVFQFPSNTQSLNPYSYVLNNPLSMTDPSGYTACDTGSATDNCPDSGRVYQGHNDSGTMDRLAPAKLSAFDKAYSQASSAVKAAYGSSASVVFSKSGEAEVAIGSNGNTNGNQSAGSALANEQNVKNQETIGAPNTLTKNNDPFASAAKKKAAEDREISLINKTVKDLPRALAFYKRMFPDRKDIDPRSVERIKLNLIRDFASGQNASTCASNTGCTIGDYSAGQISIYLDAAIAQGITRELSDPQTGAVGMMMLIGHEFEHSTTYNQNIGKRWLDHTSWSSRQLQNCENDASCHDALPWENDANAFGRAMEGAYIMNPPPN
ncbi:MAG: RHS repeat domain-containing protein [Gammaproteobacteria bacterium]